MNENELQAAFHDFNSHYFGNALKCEVVVTDNWVDDAGNYYPDSAVTLDGFFSGTVDGKKVRHATATYTHAENRIRIPRALIEGETAAKAQLLHEMAHSAVNEPEIDHGPKWHTEMNRLFKQHAPINLDDVTPGRTSHELVDQYGIGSEFWKNL
jgi:hypothetical protein